MANTVNYKGFTVEISSIDSDWSWREIMSDSRYANGVPINFIQFNAGAANDVCSIKEESESGPEIAYFKAFVNAEPRRAYYFGTFLKPFLDFSAGTYSAGSTVIIQLWKGVQH